MLTYIDGVAFLFLSLTVRSERSFSTERVGENDLAS